MVVNDQYICDKLRKDSREQNRKYFKVKLRSFFLVKKETG